MIWMRTTMLQNRFSNLAILNIEKNLSKSIKLDEVLTIFLQKK